jgi:hypothetical protein
MKFNLVFSILTLGFGLGLLHALDADHIKAISSMASGDNSGQKIWSVKRMVGFCARWNVNGHIYAIESSLERIEPIQVTKNLPDSRELHTLNPVLVAKCQKPSPAR